MGEEHRKGSKVVRTTSMIVTGSVALSISVIIIALSIVSGFRTEVRERAVGFSGQIVISRFGTDFLNDAYPLSLELSYLQQIYDCKNISHAQSVTFKHGVIKTREAVQGAVIKGVGKEFDRTFFSASISKGAFPQWNDTLPSREVLISKRMSDALHLEVSQAVDIYFVDSSSSRLRRYFISGIYDTALEGLDQSVIIGDIREVQRLNGWTPTQVGGVELLLHRPGQAERTAREIREIAARYGLEDDDPLSIKTVKEIFPHLFDWLTLIDMNLLIVMILMIAVAGVNMISGLLIMLFDKTSMIGLLKALGMKNGDIRIAFIYRMGGLIVRGMVIGNAIALLLCWIQKKYALITLDQANYAVSSVPININVWGMCLMNVVSFLLILALMLLASMTVTRITPERSLRIK